MKVILTAFGGKLQSKPMDWPEDLLNFKRKILEMQKRIEDIYDNR